LVAHPATSLAEAAGLAISAGLTTGVFGFVAAHEMIHSRDARDRALGLTLLASVLYMHFRIAHVYGHHRRAATFEDPASARLGEGLYAFLTRTIPGQFREAWEYEAGQQRRAGRAPIYPGNRVLRYVAIEAFLLLTVALVSWRALLFLLAVAVIAVALLETFNYIAHYGLSRRVRPDGRAEALAPHHSWNSGRRMNNAALFNMGRHSDHHRHTARAYERLEPLSGATELPWGYAAALLTALVPPLWRRVMDPRARAAMEGKIQAGTP
jgi:alkane 1-monooxygenase